MEKNRPEPQQVRITRADLRGTHKDVITEALRAIEYGWSARPRSTGGFALTCRCGEHHAYVPSGTKNGHIAKDLRANIEKCPRNLGKTLTNDVVARGLARRSTEEHLTTPVADAVTKDGKPVLVSERPHMSKKGEKAGKTTAYESPVTVEQVWSDGTISFRCKTCSWGGYDQRNARAVANHSGNLHRDPDNKLAQKDIVQIEEYIPPAYTKNGREYTPTERLVLALEQAISQLSDEEWNVENIAIAALKWFHERPDLGDPEERVRNNPPKTAEEQIALIRSLVDGGRYDRLESEIQNLTQALADSEAALALARDGEAKLRARLERVTEELMEGL